MLRAAHNLVLTKSQAACLVALRNGKVSKPEIAIRAKLDLTKTSAALGALFQFRLAEQNQEKCWHPTMSGSQHCNRRGWHRYRQELVPRCRPR
jgi:hypothetical protein